MTILRQQMAKDHPSDSADLTQLMQSFEYFLHTDIDQEL